jgi:hypothetical protein
MAPCGGGTNATERQCEVCDITVKLGGSEKNWDSHINGKVHQAKLKKLEETALKAERLATLSVLFRKGKTKEFFCDDECRFAATGMGGGSRKKRKAPGKLLKSAAKKHKK